MEYLRVVIVLNWFHSNFLNINIKAGHKKIDLRGQHLWNNLPNLILILTQNTHGLLGICKILQVSVEYEKDSSNGKKLLIENFCQFEF